MDGIAHHIAYSTKLTYLYFNILKHKKIPDTN